MRHLPTILFTITLVAGCGATPAPGGGSDLARVGSADGGGGGGNPDGGGGGGNLDGGGGGPDAAGGGSDGGGPAQTFGLNLKEHCDGIVAPGMGEEGQLGAVRLTPNRYPFTVTSIGYRLHNGDDQALQVHCDGAIAHRVELYVSRDAVPPLAPVLAGRIDVPDGKDPGIPQVDRTHKLAKPITLNAGDHLFVAIEHTGQYPINVLCTVACTKNAVADRNYWSGATAAPYKWVQLKSFGSDLNFLVEASGQ